MTPASAEVNARARTLAAAALIVGTIAAVYALVLDAGFVGDDFMILHRVRVVDSVAGLLRFFRGEFFEYYRPLGFVLHTVDWWIAGADPRQFHLTNLLLHAIAAMLVLQIGRALSPRSLAGPLAALLFALHASNHEAVIWISARFDLLATVFALAAIWSLVRDHRGASAIAPLFFFLALLSKESAVALPIAAAGYWVFVRRAGTAQTGSRLPPSGGRANQTLWRIAPWIAALAIYSVLRQFAGGISAVGGASRLPKLAAFGIVLGGILLLADGRAARLAAWLRVRRASVFGTLAAVLALAAALAAAGGRTGQLVAEKFAVAGFAIFNLASPVIDVFDRPFYLDPHSTNHWAGGAIALGAAAILVFVLWRVLLNDERMWFLASLLAATLLPISALTEGTRYLYLPSAAVSLIAAILIAEFRGRWRAALVAIAVAYIAVSAVQISMKAHDWVWAGNMTREGAALVEAARPPGCGGEHIVFLTSPVAIRGVYTHFYYETFELPRGCMPEVFQILARVVRLDSAVDARWDGASTIVMTLPGYRENVVVSEDLRHFDRDVRGEARRMTVKTPLGELRAEPDGTSERFTLTLAPDVRPARIRFFYYSNGRMRPLPSP
jgi:hypothetical protein